MNDTDKKILESILAKGMHELTESDKQILIARRPYLNPEQWEKYKVFFPSGETAPIAAEPVSTVDVSEPVQNEVTEIASQPVETVQEVTQNDDGLPTGDDGHNLDPDYVPSA